jgi:hypothetical protein
MNSKTNIINMKKLKNYNEFLILEKYEDNIRAYRNGCY